MFKNQMKVCLLGMAILVFSACTKEDEEVALKKVDEATQTDTKSAKVSYYLNGVEEIELEKFVKTDSSSFVPIDESNVYVFENDEKLLNWTNKCIPNARVSALANSVKEKMVELKTLQDEIKKRGIENDDAAIDSLVAELYSNTKNARTAILGVCFEHPNYAGAQLPMIAIPRRTLGDRNDWISSYSLGILTTFFEHSKWQGTKYFALVGSHPNLLWVGWDNRISSII